MRPVLMEFFLVVCASLLGFAGGVGRRRLWSSVDGGYDGELLSMAASFAPDDSFCGSVSETV